MSANLLFLKSESAGLISTGIDILINKIFFFKGKGPLQTTLAVITSAKKISEAGTKLDKLARQIADQCPESSTKKDLLAYLQRIALYCHQLNITSKVKADVQNVSGELIGKNHALKKYDQFALHLGGSIGSNITAVVQFHEIFLTKIMNKLIY